jgi:hypothetical protein
MEEAILSSKQDALQVHCGTRTYVYDYCRVCTQIEAKLSSDIWILTKFRSKLIVLKNTFLSLSLITDLTFTEG